ncbi:MAG: lytic murein transglycosylase B [Arcobacter sp.]|nr:MAG: lytic murein transglycosylase B [Arcobacter sp.]
MIKIKIIKLIILTILTIPLMADSKDYTKNLEVKKFINILTKHDKFNKQELEKLFSNVDVQNSSLKYYTKVKKSDFEVKKYHGSWDRYEKKLLNDKRIELGVEFMKRNRKTLKNAYKEYGVQAEYITAIIGVESFYGQFTGNYPVFDALTTLAFEENRRNRFFKSELRAFLKLTRKNKQNPKNIYGSFAGAIGLAQFMPSNFKPLAIDFNKDKIIDLNNESDAIGSVANYFNKSGWNKYIPIATRVSYEGKRFTKLKTGFKHRYKRSRLKVIKPKSKRFFYNKKVHLIKLDRDKFYELWYGTRNFYVITRYNQSNYYAMLVHKLAQEIKKQYKKKIRKST